MRRAIALALKGWGNTAPNPMVGAVVVRDGNVVGEGFHRSLGGPHAEAEALASAGNLAQGSTLYVTLEPCTHQGRTPPCTSAVIDAGVSRVVFATRDPNPAASGGAGILEASGIDVSGGIEEESATELNAVFFHRFTSERPWVTLKLATSIDGAIADAERGSKWITGPEAREEVHRLRTGSDAIGIGEGTLLADDPSLTVRAGDTAATHRTRVIFGRPSRMAAGSRLARSAGDAPTIVVTNERDSEAEARLASQGIDVIHARDARDGLENLRARGIGSLLVEGGAVLAGSLLDAGVVDRLVIFQAPLILGAGSLNGFGNIAARGIGSPLRFRVVSRQEFGDDLMTVYAPLER